MTFFVYIKIAIFDILDILDSDLTAFRLTFAFSSFYFPAYPKLSSRKFYSSPSVRLQFAFDSCSWLLFMLFRYACWPGSDLRFGAVGLAVGLGLEAGMLVCWISWGLAFGLVRQSSRTRCALSVLVEMRCFINILSFQIKSAMEMKWYEIWRPRRRVIKIRRALVWDVDLKFWDGEIWWERLVVAIRKFWDKDSDERVWWLLSENMK